MASPALVAVMPNQPTSIWPSACGPTAAPRWRASICAPRHRPRNGAPSASGTLIHSVSVVRKASGSLTLIGPPKMIAPAWAASVSGSGSPKRGRRMSRRWPRATSREPTRPGVECSWWSTMRTGRFASGIIAARLSLQGDAPLGRHAEKLGGAPHDVVLELVHDAVGIDQLPHDGDDTLAIGKAEAALENAGEAVEVDRLRLGLPGRFHQLVGIGLAKLEVAGKQVGQKHPLAFRHRAIHRDRVKEQRGG